MEEHVKQKVSDYIAEYLVQAGIRQGFTVTGGGAMHLNHSFGCQPGLSMLYQHHEQACAIAAESYARVHNELALLCVTTGPGGTNAITGVVGGWLDSIPMLVISGQVRYDTTARSTGLNLRAVGDQEYDICKAVSSMTKYCVMVTEPSEIRYHLEKALYLAKHGRPGPCWLDIPMNVQGATIETENLKGYEPEKEQIEPIPEVTEEQIAHVLQKVREAKRPVFYAGNGIRLAGAYDTFLEVIEKLQIPVVTAWDSIDEVWDDHPLYAGRPGIMGDRAGNFAVQNSDLVLSVGCRLSIRQVGYNFQTWAREAYVIDCDVDGEELKKPTLHVEYPIHADAADFLKKLKEAATEPVFHGESWREQCQLWRKKYPVVQKKHYAKASLTNVYAFVDTLSKLLSEGQITVVGNGSACVVGSHAWHIKKGQRFLVNSAIASMGYDLPAAIGAWEAAKQDPDTSNVILVTGDGSIQMNLQELQTIWHHRMPIKIFMISNGGYHSIRQTQNNFFGKPLVGVGPESQDLSFPDMSKLVPAYGYPYFRVEKNEQLDVVLRQVLATEGPVFCEVLVDEEQKFEPKSATKRLPDGSLVSAPLEDLAPFLPEEELKENLYIPMLKK